MLTFLKIAWRNVWRNPRRSGVVIAAMAVGLWGMLFSLGFMHGMGKQMIDNIVQSYLGHLQVHHRKFPSRMEGFNFTKFQLDYPIPDPEGVKEKISKHTRVKAWSPRLKTMGLITNAEKASGVAIFGVDPERESEVTYIGDSVVAGADLRPDHLDDILIGQSLADRLKVEVGSKVVIMTQDVNKHKAVGAYRVVGIYKIVSIEFEKVMVYMNLEALQDLLGMKGEINEIAMLIDEPGDNLGLIQRELQANFETDIEVIQWKEVFPLLVHIVNLFDIFTFIFFILVFIAMAFGIANAVLMAVFERIRELGIMKALGTRPSDIFWTVAFESLGLSVVGVIVGTALGWLTVLYFGRVGMNLAVFADVLDQMGLGAVIYTKMKLIYILWGAITAFLTAFLSSLWPAIKAARLMPVEAIRHV